MQFKRHEDLNLPIGSGITESACKTLVGGRMKRAGQRWGMEGGKSILAFRALAKSNRFDAAWIAIRHHFKAKLATNDNRPHHSLKQAALRFTCTEGKTPSIQARRNLPATGETHPITIRDLPERLVTGATPDRHRRA